MMRKLFLNDKFILTLIIINAITIFLGGFNFPVTITFFIEIIDILISFMFLCEIIIKLVIYRGSYFKSSWNVLDIILVTLSLPTIFIFVFNLEITDLSYLLVFRMLRLIKTIRFFKFIPNIDKLFDGILKGLKSATVILFVFLIYMFIISVMSVCLFKDISPEYFNNPLRGLYTIFKLFTLEGWNDIPEKIVIGLSPIISALVYLYFIVIVLTGGIFGLSIINSIFVDAMVSDNNDELEQKVDELTKKIDILLNK